MNPLLAIIIIMLDTINRPIRSRHRVPFQNEARARQERGVSYIVSAREQHQRHETVSNQNNAIWTGDILKLYRIYTVYNVVIRAHSWLKHSLDITLWYNALLLPSETEALLLLLFSRSAFITYYRAAACYDIQSEWLLGIILASSLAAYVLYRLYKTEASEFNSYIQLISSFYR